MVTPRMAEAPEARREAGGGGSPPTAGKIQHLAFGLLASRAVREKSSVVLSPPDFGNSLVAALEMDTTRCEIVTWL